MLSGVAVFCRVGKGLCVGKHLAVLEDNLQFGVLAVEVVLQTVEIAGALPFAHGQVVQQVVAAGLGTRGGHLGLLENPLEAIDGEPAHVLNGIFSRHDDIHACHAAHGPHIHDIVLGFAVAEPGGHEMLQAVHGGRSDRGLLVGLGDAQVKRGETFILA